MNNKVGLNGNGKFAGYPLNYYTNNKWITLRYIKEL